MASTPAPDGAANVVALVPAKDRADTVAATVTALRSLPAVDRVVVVDDGSSDATTDAARQAGADVLRLPANRGKGGAVRAGVEATPEADVYLLLDADVGGSAAAAPVLLEPVIQGDADLTVGVLPGADRRGGFGLVRRLAGLGIRRGAGLEPRAPLSGQRAVRASLLRGLVSAERFGLEVALTVDAARAGARIREIDVPMDHRHTGRRASGFAHRARQGADIARSLWPRLTSVGQRLGLVVLATVIALGWILWSGSRAEPLSVPPASGPERVLIVGVPHLGLEDLGTGRLATLDRLAADGAVAATSVRTLSTRPGTAEAYASLGAGTRVEATVATDQAFPAEAPLEGGTAAEVIARRTGTFPSGDVVVTGAAATIRQAGDDVSSEPGALGEALTDAGLHTAVIGAADLVDPSGTTIVRRPAPVAVMDAEGSADAGVVSGSDLLRPDTTAPFGVRADPDLMVAATEAALQEAEVVLVDPGDTDRAGQYAALSTAEQAERSRLQALGWTDELVARLVERAGDGALVLVVGVTPPTSEWELTPMIAAGRGVVPGYLHSTSTKRLGLVTLTDVAPTVLTALGVETPTGMIGAPLRYHPGEGDLAPLREQNDVAANREGVYFPIALTFIVVQAIVYVFAILALALAQGVWKARLAPILRFLVLAFAAWPLATFLFRAVPGSHHLGAASNGAVLGLTAAVAAVAARSRRHPLSPLAWICGVTAAVLVVDVATGAHLQMSSILGYSPHTAARYTGFGNTAFAVLAASAVVAAAIHVHYAPRRREALVAAAGFLLLVLVADGAPSLGADVGGVVTLVPVFGLTLYVVSGRSLSWKALGAAVGLTVLAVGVVAGIDLLRPPDARTHLARFVSDVGDDGGTFLTTVARKWNTNLRVFRSTIWTWMVPITAVFLIYVLIVARGWQRLLPPRSALRAGVVGTLVAGLLGWLVNDSGVVVTALAFVFIGPYLTLLALERERGEPVLLPAIPVARPLVQAERASART